MTRARQDWHDRMRYALDSGTPPSIPRRRRRRVVIGLLGILSAFVAVTAYASRGPSAVPKDLPTVQPVAKAVANNPEVMRRSYTAEKSTSGPAPALREAALPQLTAPSPQQSAPISDPASTGTVTPATPDTRGAAPVEAKNAAKRPPLRQAQLHSDGTQVGGSQGHRAGRGKGAERIEPSRARTDVRQARALRREGPPERVFVAAAPPVTLCLYFVVCF
jgi:hypothetical protein